MSIECACSPVYATSEYLPATQDVHWSSAESPVWLAHLPTEQRPRHCASEESPVRFDHLPALQCWHWASEEMPAVLGDHLPALQFSH